MKFFKLKKNLRMIITLTMREKKSSTMICQKDNSSILKNTQIHITTSTLIVFNQIIVKFCQKRLINSWKITLSSVVVMKWFQIPFLMNRCTPHKIFNTALDKCFNNTLNIINKSFSQTTTYNQITYNLSINQISLFTLPAYNPNTLLSNN